MFYVFYHSHPQVSGHLRIRQRPMMNPVRFQVHVPHQGFQPMIGSFRIQSSGSQHSTAEFIFSAVIYALELGIQKTGIETGIVRHQRVLADEGFQLKHALLDGWRRGQHPVRDSREIFDEAGYAPPGIH